MKLYCFMSVLSAFLFVIRLGGFLCASCGLVSFCCFVLKLCSFHSSQKRQKSGHGKTPPLKKCRKTREFSVSAVVFTNRDPNFWEWAKM